MVFLVCARDDWRAAHEIENELGKSGVELSKDRTEIESNPFWRQGLLKALRRAETLLVLWSELASLSPWLDQEIRYCAGKRVWLALDDTALPHYAQPGELRVQDCQQLLKVLGRAARSSRSASTRGLRVTAGWRRRNKIDLARRNLLTFLKRRH